MANQRRGLPDTFKLNINQAAIREKPVELGDYLDDAPASAEPERIAATPAESSTPSVQQAPARRTPPEEAVGGTSRVVEMRPAPPRVQRQPVPKPKARQKTSVPRKQVNMNTETLAMAEQLLDFCQTYSVQKDLKASELFEALVLTLYEARENLDLSRVQPRGRWGTPTARALPIALKNAFQRSIRDYWETQTQQG